MQSSATTIPAWLPVENFTIVSPMEQAPTTSTPEQEEDYQLMRLVAEGDEQALRMLIERWKGPLVNFFYRSLRSRETSEELAQTVFVRIYRAAGRYRPEARFSTFLFHVAHRLLLNELRRLSRKPLDTVDPAELKGSVSGREKLRVWEIEEAFENALAVLPDNQRTAILLLKQQELSYQEIATIMNASETAVKSWIHRARAKLKEELSEYLPS